MIYKYYLIYIVRYNDNFDIFFNKKIEYNLIINIINMKRRFREEQNFKHEYSKILNKNIFYKPTPINTHIEKKKEKSEKKEKGEKKKK